jgi:hypothetical protein
MTVEIRKAERTKAKLRLGLAGPSGAGKTMSSLKLAKGITPTGRIVMIDTERGSGDLYADLFEYDIISLQPPYKPERYVEAIHAAEEAGYDTIIIDSLSHAWSDEGGILDQADKLGKSAKNSYTVWADLTPQHRMLVGAMLNSPAHIIATTRSKQQYELEEYTDSRGNRKSRPVKLGMAPVQREGMEYEFTIFFDIDQAHNARASKDRTNLFKDEIFTPDEKVGERILAWLNSGKEAPPEEINRKKAKILHCLKLLGADVTTQEAIRKSIIGRTQLDGAKVENADAILARLEEQVKAMPPKAAAPAPAADPKPADPSTGELTAEEEAALAAQGAPGYEE